MKIGQRIISRNHPPFIVAEMSGNHNHSLELALRIADVAAQAKVHALKLQTYTAATMTLDIADDDFIINDPKSLWHGRSLYDLYDDAHTPWDWHLPLQKRCHEKGMAFFSTPFDASAVEYLESINVPAYKIASPEITDLPLIRLVASTKKPIIMSTGMSSLAELDEALNEAAKEGCTELALLKCTSTYPTDPTDSNVLTIPHLRRLFGCEVGLSDHTMGIGASLAAVAHGATIIEKHVTLQRADGGVDSAFSLEPDELSSLVLESERAWQSLGSIQYGPVADEKQSLRFRRSLYVAENMEEGDVFTPKNLRCIRPGSGLPPKYYNLIIGRQTRRKAAKGTPVTWDLI